MSSVRLIFVCNHAIIQCLLTEERNKFRVQHNHWIAHQLALQAIQKHQWMRIGVMLPSELAVHFNRDLSMPISWTGQWFTAVRHRIELETTGFVPMPCFNAKVSKWPKDWIKQSELRESVRLWIFLQIHFAGSHGKNNFCPCPKFSFWVLTWVVWKEWLHSLKQVSHCQQWLPRTQKCPLFALASLNCQNCARALP